MYRGRKIRHNKLFLSSYMYLPFRKNIEEGFFEMPSRKLRICYFLLLLLLEWSFWMDVLLALIGFLPGEEVVCFGCCGDDSGFLHFTDTEYLSAMQEETWVLTEIT